MDRHEARQLVDIAAMKRDADLARLAGAAERLARVGQMRMDIEAGLRRETLAASDRGDPVGLVRLDGHVRFMQQTLDRLAAELGWLEAEREELRGKAARSFGRASVLDELAAGLARAGRKGQG